MLHRTSQVLNMDMCTSDLCTIYITNKANLRNTRTRPHLTCNDVMQPQTSEAGKSWHYSEIWGCTHATSLLSMCVCSYVCTLVWAGVHVLTIYVWRSEDKFTRPHSGYIPTAVWESSSHWPATLPSAHLWLTGLHLSLPPTHLALTGIPGVPYSASFHMGSRDLNSGP